MALSAAAILPHSPLLIPTVGRDNISQANATVKAMKKVAQIFKGKEIDTIIIISTHGSQIDEVFTINHCPKFQADFEKFGDLITKMEIASDVGLAYKIKESLETKKQLILSCEPQLDYSVAVPMHYFHEGLPGVSLIPLYTAKLSSKEHYELGQMMRHAINETSKKIAIVAVGDLARADDKEKTTFGSDGLKEFDDLVIRLLKSKRINELKSINPKLLAESHECLYLALMILLGILNETDYKPDIFSYETPFGVGLLTANLGV